MDERFNARRAWAALDEHQRQAVGEAALLLQLASEAQDAAIDDPPTAVSRRWELAFRVAARLLEAATPTNYDLYPGGPNLAAIEVCACRICGCTDEFGCRGGCWWIEPDLCSACAAAELD